MTMPTGDNIKAKVKEHRLARSGNETEQLAVLFELEDGKTITAYLFFTEKSMKTTEAALLAMGWNATERGWMIEELNGTNMMVGAVVFLTIESEDGQDGKPRARVRWINSGPGGIAAKNPMDDQEAGGFGAALRARLGVQGGGPAPVTQPSLPGAQQPGAAPADGGYPTDDEVPF